MTKDDKKRDEILGRMLNTRPSPRPHKLPTRPVKASSNPVIVAYLNDLVLTGRYGKTPTEVAERLIAKAIDELVEKKVIEPKLYSPDMDDLKT